MNKDCLFQHIIFSPSDSVHIKAAVYKSVAEKLAKELSNERESKLAVQEELEVIEGEKDSLNEELDVSLEKMDIQKRW